MDYTFGMSKMDHTFATKKHLLFSFLSTKTGNNIRSKLTPSFMTVYIMEILTIDTDWPLSSIDTLRLQNSTVN